MVVDESFIKLPELFIHLRGSNQRSNKLGNAIRRICSSSKDCVIRIKSKMHGIRNYWKRKAKDFE